MTSQAKQNNYSYRTPFPVIWNQIKVSKHLLIKPLAITGIFLFVIPVLYAWYWFGVQAGPLAESLVQFVESIKSLQKSVPPINDFIELTSSYFSTFIMTCLILLALGIWAYYSFIEIANYAISNRKSPPLKFLIPKALRYLPRGFLNVLSVMLVLFVWVQLNQTILAPLAGFTLPIGIIILFGLMLMSPVQQVVDNRGVFRSHIFSFKLLYAKQDHFPIRTIFFHLVNITIASYFLVTLALIAVESLYESHALQLWGTNDLFNPVNALNIGITLFLFSVFGFIMAGLATSTTVLFITLKELALVTSGKAVIDEDQSQVSAETEFS